MEFIQCLPTARPRFFRYPGMGLRRSCQHKAARRGLESLLRAMVIWQVSQGFFLEPLRYFAVTIGPEDVGPACFGLCALAMQMILKWEPLLGSKKGKFPPSPELLSRYLGELMGLCKLFAESKKSRHCASQSFLCAAGEPCEISVKPGSMAEVRAQFPMPGSFQQLCLQVYSKVSKKRLLLFLAKCGPRSVVPLELPECAPARLVEASMAVPEFAQDKHVGRTDRGYAYCYSEGGSFWVPESMMAFPEKEKAQRARVCKLRLAFEAKFGQPAKTANVLKQRVGKLSRNAVGAPSGSPAAKRRRKLPKRKSPELEVSAEERATAIEQGAQMRLRCGRGKMVVMLMPSGIVRKGPYSSSVKQQLNFLRYEQMKQLAEECGVRVGVIKPSQVGQFIEWPSLAKPLAECEFVRRESSFESPVLVKDAVKHASLEMSDEQLVAMMQQLLFSYLVGAGDQGMQNVILDAQGQPFVIDLEESRKSPPSSKMAALFKRCSKALVERCVPLLPKLILPACAAQFASLPPF